jgi:hypothetical protein
LRVTSRGLGDVYKRQGIYTAFSVKVFGHSTADMILKIISIRFMRNQPISTFILILQGIG